MVRSLKNAKKLKRKNKGSKKAEGSSIESIPSTPAKVWQPGVDTLEEGEELQCDPSAYNSLHAFHIGWPCLSFDIVRDSLGLIRTEFPHSVYCVAGTQAEKASWNSIGIFKLSNISGKRRNLVPTPSADDNSDADSESSSDEEDDNNGSLSDPPVLQLRKVTHDGCVNRIRSMNQQPHICATWADTGHVQLVEPELQIVIRNLDCGIVQLPKMVMVYNDQGSFMLTEHHLKGLKEELRCLDRITKSRLPISAFEAEQVWDFTSHLNALAESEADVSTGAPSIFSHTPLMKFSGHKDEGYAIDWSPVVPGRLISGDCKNCIHLWEPSSGTWNVDMNPFVGHTASVEDLQWSPTEADVFASCSVDGKIAIWDTRIGKSPAVSVKAHDADVNVISWNRLASCMIASGSDDGTFSIRDLRLITGDSLVAHFQYHKHPITSIEWSPHEPSTVAVSSADNQLTIWDLSLERDEEEETEFKAKMKEQVNTPDDLPPQLLFVHQGQKDLKELHWHAQIPGMLISTAADGFNVLMPSNIESTLPEGNA